MEADKAVIVNTCSEHATISIVVYIIVVSVVGIISKYIDGEAYLMYLICNKYVALCL